VQGRSIEVVSGSRGLSVLRALRIHQWSKNLLVFAPGALAHRFDGATLVESLLAFVAFGCVASAGYVLNDLLDLEADRAHPVKRHRPFASGALPVKAGWALGPAALAAGIGLAALAPRELGLVLGAYLAGTFLYSYWLKRKVMADVVGLAALYTVRIFAGAAATGVPVSEWLAMFSGFVFASLALVKRSAELQAGCGPLRGRGYSRDDADVLLAFGAASGCASVLVLALYVTSHDVRRLYTHPAVLWALCPLALYWLSRVWIDARRGLIKGDPILHALTRSQTWVVAALAAAVLVVGT
jgi:4-hydroxybenzoate polyprenyltransferase